MRYVKQSTAASDIVQLFNASDAVVGGLTHSDVVVKIRKEGEGSFSTKTLTVLNFAASTPTGSYIIQWTASELDTLGLFRYTVTPATPGTFKDYEDSLFVVKTMPTALADPPTINLQSATNPGISPDPVSRGASLTVTGTNLVTANAVTVNGVAATITSTSTSGTESSVVATVDSSTPLGTNVDVVVTTSGGSATAQVDVVLAAGDIPGSGMCVITGNVYNPASGQPLESVPVNGRVLDMPNLSMGVGWADDVVSVVTDSNGKFELTLPQGVRAEVSIPRIRYRRVLTVPSSATVNLFTQIP